MPKDVITVTEIPDSGRVLDQDVNEWIDGWQNFFTLKKVVTFFDHEPFANFTSTLYSPAFRCAKYNKLGLAYYVPMIGEPPTWLYFRVEYSDDGIIYYRYNPTPASYRNATTADKYDAYKNSISKYYEEILGHSSVESCRYIFDYPVFGEWCRVGIRNDGLGLANTIVVKGFFSS